MNKIDVLFVDDSDDDALLMERIIRKNEAVRSYHRLENGEQVLLYLEDLTNPIPHIILMDLKMPKMDGLTALTHLKQDERNQIIPTVIYSSSDRIEDVEQAYRNGANGYIIKPSGIKNLRDLLNQFINYWSAVNHQSPQN